MGIINFALLSNPLATLRDWAPKVRQIAQRRDWLAPEFKMKTWQPTVTGSGAMTVSAITIREARYCVAPGDELVWYSFCITLTLGGTVNNQVNVSLPVSAPRALAASPQACGTVYEAQGTKIGIVDPNFFAIRRDAFGNYTLGAKTFAASGIYWR